MSLFLYLVRHAQSADKQYSQSDHDRELTPYGMEQSASLGKYFLEQHYFFDKIICSTAIRAKQTCQQISMAYSTSMEKITLFYEYLYSGSESHYEEILSHQEHSSKHVLMIGHNPSITQTADNFCSGITESFQPGGFMLIRFEKNQWNQLTGRGKVINIMNNF